MVLIKLLVLPVLACSVQARQTHRIARDTTKGPAPLCQVQTGTNPPTFQPNLDNPSAEDVTNAALAFLNDVCTVDSFLNAPIGGPTTVDTAAAHAVDEPTQLKTLASVVGLTKAGTEAVAALEANFPCIPANLINIQKGISTPLLGTTGINMVRCCMVLPAIKTLIQDAAAATGAFSNVTIPEPVYPFACSAIDCSQGASPGTA